MDFLQFWTGGQVTRFKTVILSGEVTFQNPMLQEVPEYQNKLCKVLGDGIKIESYIFERDRHFQSASLLVRIIYQSGDYGRGKEATPLHPSHQKVHISELCCMHIAH